MARDLPQPRGLLEMVMHPWAALKAIQGLDRLPDRRVGRSVRNRPGGAPRGVDPVDPIRSSDRAAQFYKAIGIYAFEDSRIELYAQFHEMDFDAMISSVLDAFATEAGQIDYERRRVVWCEAGNVDIQTINTRCLDRLQIDQRAFPIMRALGKNGDFMAHLHGAQNEGVVAIRPYRPFHVARVEDNIGRLLGFSPADEQGNPTQTDTRAIQAHQGAHWRLPPKEVDDIYGAGSSFLWGARIIWRQLQLMYDQVVIQRLLRRPDRILILMDVSGMSSDDAYLTCKDWERRLHREWHLDPGAGEYHTFGMPLDGAKDLVLPRGPNNMTEITTVPATNQNDLLRDVDLMLSSLAAGIGFPLGYVGRGERGDYQPGMTLSKQHQPFAKKASRLQHAFLHELARILMINLAWNNIDPYKESNQFTLHMATVAPIIEMERGEVLQLRLDRMERGIRFGADAGLNMAVWVPYVLEFWGGLQRDLVKQLYQGPAEGGGEEGAGAAWEGKHPATPPDKATLEEALLEEFGTPADSTPHVTSAAFSAVSGNVPVSRDFIPDGDSVRGSNPLLESFASGPASVPLVETQEFEMVIAGTSCKAVRPRDDEEYARLCRLRAASRREVMEGLARVVLNV